MVFFTLFRDWELQTDLGAPWTIIDHEDLQLIDEYYRPLLPDLFHKKD